MRLLRRRFESQNLGATEVEAGRGGPRSKSPRTRRRPRCRGRRAASRRGRRSRGWPAGRRRRASIWTGRARSRRGRRRRTGARGPPCREAQDLEVVARIGPEEEGEGIAVGVYLAVHRIISALASLVLIATAQHPGRPSPVSSPLGLIRERCKLAGHDARSTWMSAPRATSAKSSGVGSRPSARRSTHFGCPEARSRSSPHVSSGCLGMAAGSPSFPATACTAAVTEGPRLDHPERRRLHPQHVVGAAHGGEASPRSPRAAPSPGGRARSRSASRRMPCRRRAQTPGHGSPRRACSRGGGPWPLDRRVP